MLVKLGSVVLYILQVFLLMFKTPIRFKLILKYLEFIGFDSLIIIMLTAMSTGAVFGLQLGGIFSIFGAQSLLGGATGLALATELAPLITGFILTGRAGSAMTAELATMVVHEQITAMEAMAVNPIHYLVVPRVIASMIMMPFLCGIFEVTGEIFAYITSSWLYEIDLGVFVERLRYLVKTPDVTLGLKKMFCFSLIISLTACWFGLRAKGGARGVGVATTQSVVATLLLLLAFDFIISFLQVKWNI